MEVEINRNESRCIVIVQLAEEYQSLEEEIAYLGIESRLKQKAEFLKRCDSWWFTKTSFNGWDQKVRSLEEPGIEAIGIWVKRTNWNAMPDVLKW